MIGLTTCLSHCQANIISGNDKLKNYFGNINVYFYISIRKLCFILYEEGKTNAQNSIINVYYMVNLCISVLLR